jgi:hypothetical protein
MVIRASAWCGIVLLGFVACSGGRSSPSAPAPIAVSTPTPEPTPSPSPSPTATPAPSPSPSGTPCPPGVCEDPVTNDTPAARVTVRLYKVANQDGELQQGFTEDSQIPVGYEATIDVVAKDEEGKETLGQGPVEFRFSDERLVRVGGNHRYQRRLTVLKAGELQVRATLDGVESNPLILHLGS